MADPAAEPRTDRPVESCVGERGQQIRARNLGRWTSTTGYHVVLAVRAVSQRTGCGVGYGGGKGKGRERKMVEGGRNGRRWAEAFGSEAAALEEHTHGEIVEGKMVERGLGEAGRKPTGGAHHTGRDEQKGRQSQPASSSRPKQCSSAAPATDSGRRSTDCPEEAEAAGDPQSGQLAWQVRGRLT